MDKASSPDRNRRSAEASAPAVAAQDRAKEKLEVRSAQDQANEAVIAQDAGIAMIADNMTDQEFDDMFAAPPNNANSASSWTDRPPTVTTEKEPLRL